MIVSYRDRRTLDFAAGERVKAFSGIERPTRLKLDRLEAATALKDLAALPGNRLEALKGDRKGQYSIASASMTSGGYASNGRPDRPAL
jgi:toxin HigB-1